MYTIYQQYGVNSLHFKKEITDILSKNLTFHFFHESEIFFPNLLEISPIRNINVSSKT